MNVLTYSSRAVAAAGLGLAMLASMFAFAVPAFAAQSPAGCTADNSVVNISSNAGTAVPGATLTFTVSAGNSASGDGCDITGRTVTLTLPNGSTFNYGPANYPNPTAVAMIGDEDYVADIADLVGGFWTATVEWDGTLKSVSDIPSNGDKGVSVVPILPLEVEKTATGSFDREWDWTIEKSVDDADLLLAEGESFTVNYDVEVDATADDTNHQVEGTITITNPEGNPDATIDALADIADELDSGADMVVVCEGAVFPETLEAGESLNCTYSGAADGTEDDNTVTVTTSGTVPGNSDTAAIAWDANPTTESDECIDVSDTVEGVLGTVCASDAPETFEYSVTFGPEGGEGVDEVVACGTDEDFPNTASFVTNDTQTVGDDDASVHVEVNCQVGCTLTQGYWKTHNDSFKGGAPTDDNWDKVTTLAELTGFFTNAVPYYPVAGPNTPPFTWFGVFNTPPKGNAYYNLAHQYMAAKLNVLNGAGPTPAVTSAISSAETFFTTYTPASFNLLGKKSPVRTQVIGWAGTLGSFNEGTTGPGHCDEQNPV